MSSGGLRHVLEAPVAQVPVEAVVVEGEGGDRDVEPAVAVEVAGVGAHAGLGTTLAVQGDAGHQPDALEAVAAPVAVEEVGIGVVGHEDVGPPVAVVVGGHHPETVGLRRVGEAERLRRLLEGAVPLVLEEEVGGAREPRRAQHHLGETPPHQEAPGGRDLLPGGGDVAGHVQVQVAVPVRVEEGAPGAPAAGRHAGLGRHVLERAVSLVPEQEVGAVVGDVEVEPSVVVVVARAHAVAPGRRVHAGLGAPRSRTSSRPGCGRGRCGAGPGPARSSRPARTRSPCRRRGGRRRRSREGRRRSPRTRRGATWRDRPRRSPP